MSLKLCMNSINANLNKIEFIKLAYYLSGLRNTAPLHLS